MFSRMPREKGLLIHIAGASSAEIQRGIEAAQAVFDRSGVAPLDALIVRYKKSRGYEELTPAERRIDTIFDEADRQALLACCKGWTGERIPEHAGLEILWDFDRSENAERINRED
jgi:hypothetical protein